MRRARTPDDSADDQRYVTPTGRSRNDNQIMEAHKAVELIRNQCMSELAELLGMDARDLKVLANTVNGALMEAFWEGQRS